MTRRKRETTGEERALFVETLREAWPHVPTQKPDKTPPTTKQKSASPAGLDGRTSERLRRGRLEPEARLDLHGMTEAVAHRALVRFVKASWTKGLRLVLVVTGKGAKTAPDEQPFDMELTRRSRGVLKTMAPRWLAEPSLSSHVADVRSAHIRHGGQGALYIYLRKAER